MVVHLGVRRRLNRVSDMHVDNPANRDYSETRNYFESRVGPNALTMHATPRLSIDRYGDRYGGASR